MSKNNGSFFLGALFGASIAGVAALLYAPKTGKELRADIAEEVESLLVQANDYKEHAEERSVEFYDTVAEATEDIKVNLKYNMDQLKTQLSGVTDEMADDFDHVKEELKVSKDIVANEAQHASDVISQAAGDASVYAEVAADEVKAATQDSAETIKEATQQDDVSTEN
ncbi:YtxH domain-containing protein [Aerococcaceae bacterium DSM 111022]|nr:YtxH domain-containing protein [Aerococcaceae bacterium DSM 111022]